MQARDEAARLRVRAPELRAAQAAAAHGVATSGILAQHTSMLSRHHHSLSVSSRRQRLEQAVHSSAQHARELLRAAAAKRSEASALAAAVSGADMPAGGIASAQASLSDSAEALQV